MLTKRALSVPLKHMCRCHGSFKRKLLLRTSAAHGVSRGVALTAFHTDRITTQYVLPAGFAQVPANGDD